MLLCCYFVFTDYPQLRNKSVIDETHAKILSALHAYTAGIIYLIIFIFIAIIFSYYYSAAAQLAMLSAVLAIEFCLTV